MSEVLRLLLALAFTGLVLTVLCGAYISYAAEARRIPRALKRVLGAAPEAVVIAHGRGRGAGFSFATGKAAVTWDGGAWCLVYEIDELVGAELIVDGAVVARAFRGEPRRALEARTPQAAEVTLRLVFDDPKDPDFDLDLWLTGDEERRREASPAKAVQEANRWMARAEAIFRRPLPPHPEAVSVRAAPPSLQAADLPDTPTPPSREPLPAFRPANAAPPPASAAPPWDMVEEPVQDASVEDIEGLDESDEIEDEEDWDEIPRRLR